MLSIGYTEQPGELAEVLSKELKHIHNETLLKLPQILIGQKLCS